MIAVLIGFGVYASASTHFTAVYGAFGGAVIGMMATYLAVYATLLGAVLNVALDLALIPEHGMLGAATASASAQLIVSCVGFYLAARSLHVRPTDAALVAVALIGGIFGDVALLLTYTGSPEVGLMLLAASALAILGAGVRFIRDERRTGL